jgi:2-polyprenyl-3-methyl-5-hydroxy-6-metoxy-1,4-benzoquinol methylase
MSTVEKQYNRCIDIDEKHGRTPLGLMSNQGWHDDPKRLVFVLSRYKFVSKLMAGRHNVLEIGCADAFGTRIVRQAVPNVTATDIDPIFIEDCLQREKSNGPWPMQYLVHDIVKGPIGGDFDGVFSLDVFEHIPAPFEHNFVRNVCTSMSENGLLIVGIPSLESQVYASPGSKEGHVNCKSGEDFRALFAQYFHTTLLFSMSDEVVHTGFSKMANYLFVVCTGKKA